MRRALPRWFDLSVWPLLDVVVWGAMGLALYGLAKLALGMATEATRTVLAGRPVPWDDLAVAGVGAVVGAGLSLVFVVRMLHVFRARGYVTRFS